MGFFRFKLMALLLAMKTIIKRFRGFQIIAVSRLSTEIDCYDIA